MWLHPLTTPLRQDRLPAGPRPVTTATRRPWEDILWAPPPLADVGTRDHMTRVRGGDRVRVRVGGKWRVRVERVREKNRGCHDNTWAATEVWCNFSEKKFLNNFCNFYIFFFTLSFKAESSRDWNSFHDDERWEEWRHWNTTPWNKTLKKEQKIMTEPSTLLLLSLSVLSLSPSIPYSISWVLFTFFITVSAALIRYSLISFTDRQDTWCR